MRRPVAIADRAPTLDEYLTLTASVGWSKYVQDIAVLPSHQGLGVGHAVMVRLMRWLADHAPARAFAGLFSATGKAPFYERHGFTAAGPGRPGTYQYLERE